MVGVVEDFVLFFEFEGWGGVGVEDLFNVCACMISVFSASHPNVAGEDIFRGAVGEAGEQQLLLSVVR